MILNVRKASVGTSLVLAVIALVGYAYTRANAPPTYHLANGVDVTPINVQSDDTAEVLNVKVWKFDVVTPYPNRDYIFGVILYRNGKQVESLGGTGSSSSVNGQRYKGRKTLFIGMVPVDGDFWQAHQIRAKYMIEEEGGYSSNTFVNPFSPGMALRDYPQSYGPNSICLMHGDKGNDNYGKPINDTAIVLIAYALPASH